MSVIGVSRGGIELVGQAIDNANLLPEPNLEIPTRGTSLFRAEFLRVLVMHCCA